MDARPRQLCRWTSGATVVGLCCEKWTYSSANHDITEHKVGTAWAMMLSEIMQKLIEKHGKDDGPWLEFRSTTSHGWEALLVATSAEAGEL